MIYDLIIVGAGPAGLATALEAQKAGLNYLVIDKAGIVDTIRRYPTYSTFFSTADLLEIDQVPFPTLNKQPTRVEALNYYSKIAVSRKLNLRLYTSVSKITKQKDAVFLIETDKKKDLQARNVVLAIGYFDQANMLNIKGENLAHVSHYYTEPYAYIGQKVLVVGGSNSAVEAVLDLWRHGAEPVLVHRKAELYPKLKYWVKPDIENRIKEGSIKAYFNTQITSIDEQKVHLIDSNKKEFSLDIQHVLLLTGYHPDGDFLMRCGVHIDRETLVPEYDSTTHETNVEGLYIAGTVCTGIYTGKIFIENSRHHGSIIIKNILTK